MPRLFLRLRFVFETRCGAGELRPKATCIKSPEAFGKAGESTCVADYTALPQIAVKRTARATKFTLWRISIRPSLDAGQRPKGRFRDYRIRRPRESLKDFDDSQVGAHS